MTINFNYWKTRVVRYPLLVITGLAAVVGTGLNFDFNKSEWAYWVQALGSIGAIVGTWYATKTQLLHANKARKIQRLEDEVGNTLMGFELATDTCEALSLVASKFAAASKESKRLQLGTERLQAISTLLHNFATRQIPPLLYVEILRLQREVAFTITAINKVGVEGHPVPQRRVKNAERRHAAVSASKLRCMAALNKAQRAAGITVEAIDRGGEDDDRDS